MAVLLLRVNIVSVVPQYFANVFRRLRYPFEIVGNVYIGAQHPILDRDLFASFRSDWNMRASEDDAFIRLRVPLATTLATLPSSLWPLMTRQP
jgi:hypothetical protein